jgi:hypothetical protein
MSVQKEENSAEEFILEGTFDLPLIRLDTQKINPRYATTASRDT